ncbi:hypothetical protein BD309DRAFT_947563 [Dichomitus squalens]|uniref:Uncharacterized protein n=2 Tax=Dichomitus squalens TaxID=114155 RepID=A0A4Q9QAB9_9APHY|nr:uncharacterized protein DICSQDRAFT_106087 [Dichomitus squalens LYAD-421 SS1]EJF61129.1 hypothetical protein DICSQDRAFT_106087 [Dichomitus squalens LYAD-421 SS1]TBU49377.1 hypothetical protein BD309DRAFT_947563 [Dichomitus squalens]TBU64026.1 hypothetical protein BD310DRAFT_807109 [Dichomitus squalens]
MLAATFAALSLLAHVFPIVHATVLYPLIVQSGGPWSGAEDAVKVPVTLGVMSACPDAILCESVFDHVVQRVADKVDLTLTFIGKLNSSEPDFGVTCMHGSNECAGNVQELCAIKYAPFQQWWPFVQCQNFQGRYEVGKPETALKCAKAADLDWENSGVGACAGLSGDGKGEEGIRLLQKSVVETRLLGVEKSCTVIINGKQVCIRDGAWKQCEGGHAPSDFIRQIEEEFDKLNSD